MSFAAINGKVTAAQCWYDDIVNKMLLETQCMDDRNCFARILFWSFKSDILTTSVLNASNDKLLTNNDMLVGAVKCARALATYFKKGDLIAVFATNHVDYFYLYYGAIFAGMVLFQLDPDFKPDEIKNYFSISPPVGVFANDYCVEKLKKILRSVGIKPRLIVFGSVPGEGSYTDFVQGYSGNYTDYWPEAPKSEDAVMFLFTTSGSTSEMPHIVPISQKGICTQATAEWTNDAGFPLQSQLYMLRFGGHCITHTNVMTANPIFRVPTLVQSERTSPGKTLEAIKHYKPSHIITTPEDATELIQAPEYRRGDLHSITSFILTAASPSNTLLKEIMSQLTPESYVFNRYGLTECYGYVCIGTKRTKLPSFGPVLNTYLYKIVDIVSGTPCRVNEKGELLLWNQFSIAKEYLGDKDATIALYSDNKYWIRTGDVVYENETKHLVFVGRLKFMFNHTNSQVFPEELEDVICSVEGVKSVIVVCRTDVGPAALVVTKNGAVVERQRIHRAVAAKWGHKKKLKGGIAFVKDIPKTTAGKVNRHKCKELIQELFIKRECFF